jgi:glycosyltransferase involved in cell wall biosynthesis
MRKYNYIFISRSKSRSGKGNAIRRIADIVNSDYVIIMDADNSISFATIVDYIMTGITCDLTIFSRYLNSENKIPLHRKIISRGFNMLLKVILKVDINDTQSGYKIVKTDIFKKAIKNVGVTNTFFDVDLIYYLKKNGAKSLEIPTKYTHSDGSKFNPLAEVIGQGISLFAFRIRHSRIYKYIPPQVEKLYFEIFLYI